MLGLKACELYSSRSCDQLDSAYKQIWVGSATPPPNGGLSCSSSPMLSGSLTGAAVEQLSRRAAALSVSANADDCSGTAHYLPHSSGLVASPGYSAVPKNHKNLLDTRSTTACGWRSHTTMPTADAGFPFSPPQPSPMSPKLLSGLGDQALFGTLLSATRGSHRQKEHAERSQEGPTCTAETLPQFGSLFDVLKKRVHANRTADADVGREERSSDRRFCSESLCVNQSGGRADRSLAHSNSKGVVAAAMMVGRKELLPSSSEVRRQMESQPKEGHVQPPAASSPVSGGEIYKA